MSEYSRPIVPLYRSLRREARLLPTEYLRQFFRLKLGDDIRTILSTQKSELQKRRQKRAEKLLRKLQYANSSRFWAFDSILDIAYGRKGKLRAELIMPLLSDPAAPPRPPIIPSVERSRPPTYSPELTALLTSPHSRMTKALLPKALQRPPTLPERADPKSEDARLIGPLSKRREVNIHWRYFSEQHKKLYLPLQVVLETKDSSGQVHKVSDADAVSQARIRPVGLQGSGLFEEVQALACPSAARPGDSLPTTIAAGTNFPPRFLRRRFRSLLGRLPILTYQQLPDQAAESASQDAKTTGRYHVSLASDALSNETKLSPLQNPIVDDLDLMWKHAAEAEDERLRGGRKLRGSAER